MWCVDGSYSGLVAFFYDLQGGWCWVFKSGVFGFCVGGLWEKKKNPDKDPYEPIARDVWMDKNNEDTDYTSAIRNAALNYADSMGIKVDVGKDTGSAGGWSAGGDIAISVESGGVRQAKTIIHEIAHELIHWAERKEKGQHKLDYGKKEIETDAEASAYIVMKHFGFDMPTASNYLALHGVDSAGVRKRKSYIQKAVKQIIDGMYANFPDEYKQATKTHNWYKSARRKNIYKNIFNSL